MNGIEWVPVQLLQWVLSTSAMACLIVGLIVLGKKVLGHRLPPRWHYVLWFVLMAKLILPWKPESNFSVWNAVPERNLPVIDATIEAFSPISPEINAKPDMLPLVLFIVWLAVFLGMVLYAFGVNRRFAWKLHQEREIDDPDVLDMFEACKQRMSIRRNIRLVESDLVSAPALFGFLRPCLIIPNLKTLALRPDQLRYIFLHELAHARRNDIAANWVMRLLLAVHWFNPFIWYACYRMREDQEIACDALALTRVHPDETKSYGHTLIEMFEKSSTSNRVTGIAGLFGNMPKMKRRIAMIRSFRPSSRRRSLFGAAVLIVLCLFVMIADRAPVQAALPMPATGSAHVEGRIIKLSSFKLGVETQRSLLLAKENGNWKIRFIKENGEIDPEMNDATGVLTFPERETIDYNRPGIRYLVFVKSEFDVEWKLAAIKEGIDAVKQYLQTIDDEYRVTM